MSDRTLQGQPKPAGKAERPRLTAGYVPKTKLSVDSKRPAPPTSIPASKPAKKE